MEIVRRIAELVNEKAKSKRDFAFRIGIPERTLSTYLKTGRTPSLEVIDAILRTFPEISAEWLLRGEGSMVNDGSVNVLPELDDIEPKFSHVSAMYELLLKDRDEQIEELKSENSRLIDENNHLKGENSIMREQLGIGARPRGKSA